jgi:hypothetical protein
MIGDAQGYSELRRKNALEEFFQPWYFFLVIRIIPGTAIIKAL